MGKQLREQQEERQKLCGNIDNLVNTSNDQCKELRRANRELQSLKDRLSQLEKKHEELNTEVRQLSVILYFINHYIFE